MPTNHRARHAETFISATSTHRCEKHAYEARVFLTRWRLDYFATSLCEYHGALLKGTAMGTHFPGFAHAERDFARDMPPRDFFARATLPAALYSPPMRRALSFRHCLGAECRSPLCDECVCNLRADRIKQRPRFAFQRAKPHDIRTISCRSAKSMRGARVYRGGLLVSRGERRYRLPAKRYSAQFSR